MGEISLSEGFQFVSLKFSTWTEIVGTVPISPKGRDPQFVPSDQGNADKATERDVSERM